MRIISLYIKSFGPFEEQILNFVSDIRCRIVGSRLVLDKENRIPNDFFSLGGGHYHPISSISAVVGENGSGKSTLADVLRRVSNDDTSVGPYLLVFENEAGVICCISKGLPKGFAIPKEVRRVDSNDVFPFNIVYLAPGYALMSRFDEHMNIEKAFHDLSTTGLLETAWKQVCDVASEGDGSLRSPMEELAADETRRMFEVSRKLVDATSEDREMLGIRMPTGIRIRLNESALAAAVVVFNRFCSQAQITFWTGWVKKVKDWRVCAFLYYVIIFCKDRCGAKGSLSNNKRDRLCREMIDVVVKVMRAIESDSKAKSSDVWLMISEFLDSKESADKKFKREVRRCFDALESVVGNRMITSDKNIDVSFREKKRQDLVLQLFALHQKITGKMGFLEIVFAPAMSSGEMAYLGVWGRLDSHFSKPKFKRFATLLIIDEGETSLHPLWQRNFVRNIIWFFERYHKVSNVHLLIASHSPMLLSDVPGGNVCYLCRRESREAIEEMPDPMTTKTFAANTYSLLRLPFFMKDGPIGAFASLKLDDLIVRIKKAQDTNSKLNAKEHDKLLVSLCGDTFVSNYLMMQIEARK